jgi:hypothetical protein
MMLKVQCLAVRKDILDS